MDLDKLLNGNNIQSTTSSIATGTTATNTSTSTVIRKNGRLSRHEQKKRKRNGCNFVYNNNTNDYTKNVTIVNQNEEQIIEDEDDNYYINNSSNSNRRRASTKITNNNSDNNSITKNDNVVLYQDMFTKYYNDDLSIAFFELANASKIAYDISTVLSTTIDNNDDNNKRNQNDNIQVQKQRKQKRQLLVFQQDLQTNGSHTGGIVWETSYLLLEYLLLQYDTIGHVLELGSGSCGLLGQCLAGGLILKQQQYRKQHKQQIQTNSISSSTVKSTTTLPFQSIVLTDTKAVINNLQNNVQSNLPLLQKLMNDNHNITNNIKSYDINDKIHVCELDWTNIEHCVQKSNGILEQGKYDIIVGTDILFAPSLVVPLVQTINWLLDSNNTNTIVYICIHQRCIDTLQLFYKISSTITYNLHIYDISQSIYKQYPTLLWGKSLDCILLRITRGILTNEGTPKKQTIQQQNQQQKLKRNDKNE